LKKLKVGVFHPGTQHSWQTALAFQETEQLEWYLTSVFFNDKSKVGRFISALPSSLSKVLKKE
jgi:hypothetical protein